jgi:hypothetical protein
MPVLQSGIQAWTYADAVQYLLDAHGVDGSGMNRRHARAAVQKAYRELPSKHSWNYFTRQRLLQTVASYDTGTIAFDFTGGASERLVTLTTGTWPSWAAYGRIIIDDVHYEVATRESDTLITLSETSNPGADVAAGATYTLYRNAYPLPSNFKRIVSIWDVDQERQLRYVDAREHHTALQVFYTTPDTPWHFTVRATGDYLGSWEILFGPPPNTLRTYDLLYEIAPRPLAIEEYSSGTVACSASTAVTGTNTVFPTNCAGAIMRFSSTAVKPSSHLGSLDGNDNLYVEQSVIKTRSSATAIVLEEAISSTIAAGSGFTISDPLDLEPHSMLSAFLAMAEAEFSRIAMRKDAETKYAMANRAVLEAMAADGDAVTNQRGRMIYNPYRHGTITTDA